MKKIITIFFIGLALMGCESKAMRIQKSNAKKMVAMQAYKTLVFTNAELGNVYVGPIEWFKGTYFTDGGINLPYENEPMDATRAVGKSIADLIPYAIADDFFALYTSNIKLGTDDVTLTCRKASPHSLSIIAGKVGEAGEKQYWCDYDEAATKKYNAQP